MTRSLFPQNEPSGNSGQLMTEAERKELGAAVRRLMSFRKREPMSKETVSRDLDRVLGFVERITREGAKS